MFLQLSREVLRTEWFSGFPFISFSSSVHHPSIQHPEVAFGRADLVESGLVFLGCCQRSGLWLIECGLGVGCSADDKKLNPAQSPHQHPAQASFPDFAPCAAHTYQQNPTVFPVAMLSQCCLQPSKGFSCCTWSPDPLWP